MAKFGASDDNALVWVPDAEQSAVLDWLAMGYSQNAAARLTGVTQSTIWSWVNERSFSEQFRTEITRRAQLFADSLEQIEQQQLLTAIAVFGRALQGDLPRDDDGNVPLEYLAATELLRPRWRARAGERWRRFGDAP